MTNVLRQLTGLLACATLTFANAAAAAETSVMQALVPSTAKFEAKLDGLPFRAEATQSLVSRGGNLWRLELRVDSFLLDSVEYSEFRWDGEHCRTVPESYGYTRSGVGRNKEMKLVFDHSAGSVTRTDKEGTTRFALPRNTEDKLGHMLGVACRLARGARSDISLQVAWDRDVRQLDYQVGALEKVATPLATYDGWRVTRKRTDSDRITTTWIAPAAGWQPVQMQHTEDGRMFQLRLLELRR